MKHFLIFVTFAIAIVIVKCQEETKFEHCINVEFDISDERKKDIMYSEGEMQTWDEKCYLSCFMLGFELVSLI